MSKKLSISDWNPAGAKVLVRVDFNVPLDGERNITDETRITAALPTIRYLTGKGAKVILMSHLGRPKGKTDPALSLRPVADRLAELLEVPVKFAQDTVGPDARRLAEGLVGGEVLLLENLRYNPGETANDPAFAGALAGLGEFFVNDAFGTAHRAHASTVGVPQALGGGRAGFLMEMELAHLGGMLAEPERPFVAILGGAKVSGKVDVILNLLDRVDTLLLGGGMIFTFFRMMGLNIGSSLLDVDSSDVVREILAKARTAQAELILPEDCLVADEFAADAKTEEVLVTDIPADWMGLDIGSRSRERFSEVISTARSIFWNGPMGVFELPPFAGGTRAVGMAVAEATSAGATSVVGGGDSVAAVNHLGLAERISHISTGGGASLEFMAGRTLPGVEALSPAEGFDR
ncbi:phosphoglycerate kinase [bacterium]|nr:phosphoglycerate kinase [bacterium]PIV81343.1 MAG: phosphoglycerate kinase [bacterium CG17_big_fil_post_rev_8_21_14_2_50_64_8]PJA75711.1 MAG: phosphoglycerate kinase [bacterium CG_4_9_14_3_um_filter_65_15]